MAAGLLEKSKKTCFYLQIVNAICGNNRYGVIKCEFRGKKGSIDVHRVIYCIANKLTLEDIAGMDARHLCHNSLCLTASHIAIEPQE